MKQLLRLLEYNFWANDLFITRLQDQTELHHDITRMYSHILAAHTIWIGRIGGKENLPGAWQEIGVDRWEELNIELYHESTDLLKSKKLDEQISYTTSKGELFENTMEDLLYHIINHSTHHRAQVALLMRKNEILPPASDYIFYLRRR